MTPDDLPRVLAAWNQVLIHDQLTEDRFRHVMLGDPNYEPEGVVIAEGPQREVLGLSASVLRRDVLGKDGGGTEWQFRRGFLKAFFVTEGEHAGEAADALLAAAEAYCRQAGKQELTVTIYTGPYVFPGVDLRYDRIYRLLVARGCRDVQTIESVAVDLRDPAHEARLAAVQRRLGPEVEVLTWHPKLLPQMTKFVAEGDMREWFPVGWENRYAEPNELTLILQRDGEILGWARYHPGRPRAGFGPILVLERERSKGYGLRLLLECMIRSRDAGSESMYAGWANTGFYIAAGWHIIERHAVLKKDLPAMEEAR